MRENRCRSRVAARPRSPSVLRLLSRRQPETGRIDRLDSGRCIVFEGGAEVRFPVPTLLTNADLEKLAQAAHEAMSDREPPADASVKIRPLWLGKASRRA